MKKKINIYKKYTDTILNVQSIQPCFFYMFWCIIDYLMNQHWFQAPYRIQLYCVLLFLLMFFLQSFTHSLIVLPNTLFFPISNVSLWHSRLHFTFSSLRLQCPCHGNPSPHGPYLQRFPLFNPFQSHFQLNHWRR